MAKRIGLIGFSTGGKINKTQHLKPEDVAS